MMMTGRKFEGGIGYRYGFSGHERLDELSNNGDNIDLGDRILDARTGRTSSMDPEKHVYAGSSPYAYGLDNPMNIVDPNGRLIIFVNGFTVNEGGKATYWNGVDQKIINRIGDRHVLYRDGTTGGMI